MAQTRKELEHQKNNLQIEKLENERDKFEDESKDLMEKVERLKKDKVQNAAEFDATKKKHKVLTDKHEKLILEKQNIILDFQNMQRENEKLKTQIKEAVKSSKNKEKNSPRADRKDPSEALYKQEIINLKQTLKSKEELISTLKDKVKQIENEKNTVSAQITENMEKFNTEITKRNGDLEYYKKSYEDQKSRVNKEHELLAGSLYEMTLQFVNLKNELNKRISLRAEKAKK